MLSVTEGNKKLFIIQRESVSHDWMGETRSQIDDHLNQLLRTPLSSPVTEAMRYSVLAPGKRLRPLLMLAIADFFGVSPPGIMRVACVIEMIHSASLILDDLPCMDNDHERRNRLSTHAKFGEDLSILAAISLLMQCHSILASDDSLAPESRLKLIQLVCETIGSSGLSLGQYIDLNSTEPISNTFSIADIHHLKTGILFVAAARAGCLLCNASARQEAIIVQFTSSLGLAFQVKDDLTDLDDTSSNLVKEIGIASAKRRFDDYLDAANDAIDGEPNAAILQRFTAAMFNTRS